MYMEHVNLTVKNIEKTTQLLGSAFPDFHIRGQGVRKNYHWLHFGNDETYLALGEYINGEEETSQVNHVGLVVNNLDTIIQRMEKAGYQPSEIAEHSPFRRRCYYHDDNGIEWEFIHYLSDKTAEKNCYEH